MELVSVFADIIQEVLSIYEMTTSLHRDHMIYSIRIIERDKA